MKKALIAIPFIVILFLTRNHAIAQNNHLEGNYVGFLPAILVEPYDTIDAVEINTIPIMYEFRTSESNDLGFQIRPLVNYRILEGNSGISQIGGTIVANKYFTGVFEEDFWLIPQLGLFYTYTYNRLDEIQSMTLGFEPGAYMVISDHWSLSVNLQPGINYYPDDFSKEFVETESGFKGHFGIIAHIGYNF